MKRKKKTRFFVSYLLILTILGQSNASDWHFGDFAKPTTYLFLAIYTVNVGDKRLRKNPAIIDYQQIMYVSGMISSQSLSASYCSIPIYGATQWYKTCYRVTLSWLQNRQKDLRTVIKSPRPVTPTLIQELTQESICQSLIQKTERRTDNASFIKINNNLCHFK